MKSHLPDVNSAAVARAATIQRALEEDSVPDQLSRARRGGECDEGRNQGLKITNLLIPGSGGVQSHINYEQTPSNAALFTGV